MYTSRFGLSISCVCGYNLGKIQLKKYIFNMNLKYYKINHLFGNLLSSWWEQLHWIIKAIILK